MGSYAHGFTIYSISTHKNAQPVASCQHGGVNKVVPLTENNIVLETVNNVVLQPMNNVVNKVVQP